MPDLRELRLRFPEYSIKHWIEPTGVLLRTWGTAWRGTLVISGRDQAFALCELTDCTAVEIGGLEYFTWKLDNLRMLETPLRHLSIGAQAWNREAGPEPVACAASLCAELRELIQPGEPIIEVSAPTKRFEFVPAAVSEIGQLAMF